LSAFSDASLRDCLTDEPDIDVPGTDPESLKEFNDKYVWQQRYSFMFISSVDSSSRLRSSNLFLHYVFQLEQRFKECGLDIHPEKTKIVYCKDGTRKQDNN
jgi:hypothetical protein